MPAGITLEAGDAPFQTGPTLTTLTNPRADWTRECSAQIRAGPRKKTARWRLQQVRDISSAPLARLPAHDGTETTYQWLLNAARTNDIRRRDTVPVTT